MMTPTERPLLARYWREERARIRVHVIFAVVFFQAVLRKEFVGLKPDKFLP